MEIKQQTATAAKSKLNISEYWICQLQPPTRNSNYSNVANNFHEIWLVFLCFFVFVEMLSMKQENKILFLFLKNVYEIINCVRPDSWWFVSFGWFNVNKFINMVSPQQCFPGSIAETTLAFNGKPYKIHFVKYAKTYK